MVRPLEGRPGIFLCEECGLGYAEQRTAEACEAYCKSHASCSIEITAKAIYPREGEPAREEG